MRNNRAGRPVTCRSVEGVPKVTCFLPEGIPPEKLQNVVLSVDEVEAMRLADMLGLYQADAAERMKISRQTFGRIIQSARGKVAEALVEGKTICIEGGNIFNESTGRHTDGQSVCVCLYCGFEKPHQDGVPCRTELCPDCSKALIRKGRFSSVE